MPPETKYYDLLGVSYDASENDIRKAYKRSALKYHPDKTNHDSVLTEKFKDVTRAYEVLSNQDKKQIYDQYGENGLNGAVPNPAQSFPQRDNFFNHFFGSLGGASRPFDNIFNQQFARTASFMTTSQQQQGPRKGKDILHKLTCTLEDLYSGKIVKLALNKTIMCPECNGVTDTLICGDCNGAGIFRSQQRIGPFMQTMQTSCKSCRGMGRFLNPNNVCQTCKGNKVIEARQILEVEVPPGSNHNDKITINGAGDQAPSIVPGDVVVVIEEAPHETFRRSGKNLLYNKVIDLKTALAGGSFKVRLLNKRLVKVEIIPGEIISPGSVKMISRYGMPVNHNDTPILHDQNGKRTYNLDQVEKGDLFVQFKVKFPKELSTEQLKAISELFPSEHHGDVEDGEVEEDVFLTEATYGQFHNSKKRRFDQEDDLDDE